MNFRDTVRLRAKLLVQSIRFRFGRNYVVNGVGNRIYFNPLDYRGQRMWRCGGGGDRDAIRQWGKLVEQVDPSVVVDVGANYGEVALSCRYRAGTEIHLVEPNLCVVRYLEKSVSPLRGENNVQIHRLAASDKREPLAFYESIWNSGRSTMEVGLRHRLSKRIVTSSVRLSDLLDIDGPFLFKIDVEGAEVRVIEGMKGLFAGREWAGIFEYLHLSPEDAQRIAREFRVFLARREDLALVPADAAMLVEEAKLHKGAGKVRFAQNAVILPRIEGVVSRG